MEMAIPHHTFSPQYLLYSHVGYSSLIPRPQKYLLLWPGNETRATEAEMKANNGHHNHIPVYVRIIAGDNPPPVMAYNIHFCRQHQLQVINIYFEALHG